MSRPCRWPDGGCGESIIDVITVAGKKQVLDATPSKGIILVRRGPMASLEPYEPGADVVSRVVDTYVDHHATCAAWARLTETARAVKVERERAAKAAGS